MIRIALSMGKHGVSRLHRPSATSLAFCWLLLVGFRVAHCCLLIVASYCFWLLAFVCRCLLLVDCWWLCVVVVACSWLLSVVFLDCA